MVLIFSPSLFQYHFKPLISSFAKRFGWIAVVNMALVFFLALKNTPLAFLSATSYEKLQPLHQIAGYWTIFAAILHGVLYTITFAQNHVLDLFKERDQYVGVIAGFAMLLILASTISVVRRRRYEVFYVIHISMIIVILITVGLHRPDLTLRTLPIVLFAGSIWILDRVLRSAKT
ncbi:MAG: FAD-binding 8 [Lasallia pustulata]|uniref:FAD-binding 8 n=1 Tax=Lasallia pustulata TaxID=136370 RepID=A0A5M8PJG1_9LECA|nr:MAG: FAD-binding 8 [Lasallia pustulata]